MLTRFLFAAVLAFGLALAPSLPRAESLAPVAKNAAADADDPGYLGLSRNTVMAIAGATAAVAVGTAAAVYTFGAASVVAVAGTLWAAHVVVEAAVLAGAGALGYNVFGDDEAPVRAASMVKG